MPRISQAELSAVVEEILIAVQTPEDIARTVAEALVEADLHGHHSHGIRMIPKYVERIRQGMIDPAARPEVVYETENAVTIDGHSTLGQYTAQAAIERGLSKSKAKGIAIVGIQHGTHLGCIGTWARRTTTAGAGFLAFVCNPTSTYVAPPGTAEGRLSTNPVAVGLPSFGALSYPLVLDMATSQVAFGKVAEAAAAEESVPDEWAGPYEGKPDPEQIVNGPGTLLPLGGTVSGYKGFGLAVMSELFASTIADAVVSGEPEAEYGNTAAFIFVDPLQFTTEERIEERITAFREYVLSGEPNDKLSIGHAAKGETLRLPGEPEHRDKTKQIADGINIRSADAKKLQMLTTDLGLDRITEVLADQ